MKKVLITGFDPFGGESINPSWEAVTRLPDRIGELEIIKKEIPTVFVRAADAVIEYAEEISPDVIICVGQAGGRAAITPEVVAINLCEASIADNEGNKLCGVPAIEGAPAAYFTTIPVREMVAAIKVQGILAALSYSAGAFVCNETLYRLLHHFRDSNVKIGFIHVPFLPEQTKEGVPSIPLDSIVSALTVAIKTLE